MSTSPADPVPLEQLELAEAFFAELGVPFSWHVDSAGTFHASAFVDDLVDVGGRRGAPARRRPGRRRSQKR